MRTKTVLLLLILGLGCTGCGILEQAISKAQNMPETQIQDYKEDTAEELDPKDISMDAYYSAYKHVMDSDYIRMPFGKEDITCNKDGTIVQRDYWRQEQDGSYTPVYTLYSTPTDAYLKLYEDREKYTIYHASEDIGTRMQITKADSPDNWEYAGIVHVWGTDYIAIKDNENDTYNLFYNGPVLKYEGQTDTLDEIETYGFTQIRSTTLDSPDTWGVVDEETTGQLLLTKVGSL